MLLNNIYNGQKGAIVILIGANYLHHHAPKPLIWGDALSKINTNFSSLSKSFLYLSSTITAVSLRK